MQIRNAIVHRLQKDRFQESVLHIRDDLLQVDEALTRLLTEVRDVYTRKAGKSYGRFQQDQDVYPVSRFLRQLLDGQFDFIEFTRRSMNTFKRNIDPAQLATGGFVLFVQYAVNQNEYLMTVMLNDQLGTAIDPETLEINDTRHLDLSHLHLAARVDLGAWDQGREEKYLSFVKGRASADSVSKYFRDFLGCAEYTDARDETRTLLRVVQAYCEDQGFGRDATARFKGAVHDYCEARRKSGSPVHLDELSRAIDEENPDSFFEFANGEEHRLSNVFDPDRATLRQLKRFQGKDQKLSIAFDQDLLGVRVIYDSEERTLLIRNLPDELARQLDEQNNN